jgi:hypothetical protein
MPFIDEEKCRRHEEKRRPATSASGIEPGLKWLGQKNLEERHISVFMIHAAHDGTVAVAAPDAVILVHVELALDVAPLDLVVHRRGLGSLVTGLTAIETWGSAMANEHVFSLTGSWSQASAGRRCCAAAQL